MSSCAPVDPFCPSDLVAVGRRQVGSCGGASIASAGDDAVCLYSDPIVEL
jgi:hypothetical protein